MRCSWCRNIAPLNYPSPDPGIKFCSAWCRDKYYSKNGIPEKRQKSNTFLLILIALGIILLFIAWGVFL